MSGAWTCGLEQAIELAQVGGKARGLARLHEAGFNVPYGFCVTAQALAQALVEVSPGQGSLQALQQGLRRAPLPRRLVQEVRQRMEGHEGARWAVRSSGVEEDAGGQSMAGLHLTRLGVKGLEGVLEALREVWASAYALDALLYRDRVLGQPIPSGMGVVIQRMVEASCAGVIFTRDPLGADPYEAVISAARGLGEQVVQGQAQDTYYMDRRTGYIKRVDVASGQRLSEGVLGDVELRALASAARALDASFGGAQDAEWAFDDRGQLHLLQLRPITTIKPGVAEPGGASAESSPKASRSRGLGANGEPAGAQASEPSVAREQLSVWSNANVGEALPGVGTPLTWSIIRGFSQRGFERAFGSMGLVVPVEHRLVDSFRGRVYLNLTEFMSIASAIPLIKAQVLFSMAGGGGAQVVEETYTRRSSRDFLLKLPLTIPRVALSQVMMPAVAPVWERHFSRQRDAFFDRALDRLHPGQLVEVMDQVDRLFEQNGLIMLTCSSNFLMSFVLMHEALLRLGGPQAAQQEQGLLSGLKVKSAEPGLDLLQLGRLARRSLRLRQIITSAAPERVMEQLRAHAQEEPVAQFMEALERFRRAHGHRAPREAELATPRWREDTTFLFEVLRGFIDSPHLPTAAEVAGQQRAQHEQALRRVHEQLWPGTRGAFGALLGLVRTNARWREALRGLVVDSLDMYRALYKECGRRMARGEVVEQEDDVFFLTTDEVRAWLADARAASDYRVRVVVRRAVHEAYKAMPDPPQTFVLKGHEIIAEEEYLRRRGEPGVGVATSGATAPLIFGLPGASGKVSGLARVMHDPGHSEPLRPGEILVVPFADVGWTPLFLSAAGVVMSLGGPLSHACIVAREYGIPTVVNAREATTRIQTGDRITLDGDQGVVYLVERAQAPEQSFT